MPVPLGQFETTASGGDLAEADRRLSGEHSSDDAASPGGTLDRNSEDYNSVCIGAGHAQPVSVRARVRDRARARVRPEEEVSSRSSAGEKLP